MKSSSILLLITLFSSLSLPISSSNITSHGIPAVFAFGDSTVDPGNNNCFVTLFKGDHLPYSCNLPNQVPSGRFSNGRIGTDFVVQMLGLKEFLPAYLDPQVTDHDLVTGVSFASGGSGLDSQTVAFSGVMSLDKEFELFQECLTRIRGVIGDANTTQIVGNALFVVSIGSNDVLYNAYLTPTRILSFGSISSYHDFLLDNLMQFVQTLYEAGARRILVSGLPPVGCLPILVSVNNLRQHFLNRVCNSQQNMDSESYNTKLKSRIITLQTTHSDAKIAYFNVYSYILDMVTYPTKYGFTETLQGCCGTGLVEMGPLCNVADQTCTDPQKYLFWDAVHLTETGYGIIAENGKRDMLPYFIG